MVEESCGNLKEEEEGRRKKIDTVCKVRNAHLTATDNLSKYGRSLFFATADGAD
ncbi:MAG: hypothetical protein HC942_09740 [Microcoleus sp. SU_5_6]|nr:hypothetical protein [Microcoleus sp. SU_5_6]